MRRWDYPERERAGADHDQPYRFGRHPTSYLHVREFARLLIVRSRLRESEALRHDTSASVDEAA